MKQNKTFQRASQHTKKEEILKLKLIVMPLNPSWYSWQQQKNENNRFQHKNRSEGLYFQQFI